MNVIELRPRKPTPAVLRCQTPGHEDREARPYPGGRLCDGCIRASRQARKGSSDEKESAA